MLREKGEWSGIIEACNYVDSVLDTPVAESNSPEVRPFVCLLCSDSRPAFPSHKALASHQRTSHGVRSPMRAFAEADGLCPICKTCFNSRLRLLAHLSDTRRPKCRDKLLSGTVPPLSHKRIAVLDELDKVTRRNAQRLGQTHPVAIGSAVRANGKRIGHVQA